MPRRSALALLALLAVGLPAAVACYDWDLGPSTSDGGDDGTARRDALQKTPEARPVDVVAAPDAHDAGHDVDAGSPRPDAAACPSLLAQIDAASTAARVCISTDDGVCLSHVADPCGCPFFVAEPGSAATERYQEAVAALDDAGCSPGCAGCRTPATSSLCLAGMVGSGLGTMCSPP